MAHKYGQLNPVVMARFNRATQLARVGARKGVTEERGRVLLGDPVKPGHDNSVKWLASHLQKI